MPNDETINVRYMVDDVEESIAFYTKLLGFELLDQRLARVRRCQAGQPPAAALRAEELGGSSDARRCEAWTGGWNRIHFIVDDLDTEVARLRDAGATFRNDVVEGPGGKQILLQDPSGNVVELFQPASR